MAPRARVPLARLPRLTGVLRPVLGLLGLALVGCPNPSCPPLRDSCASDTSFDSDRGFARVFLAGEIQTSSGEFVTGHFGYEFADLDGLPLCISLSQWSKATAPVAGDCPGCEWAFNLTLQNGTAEGDHCDAFGVSGNEWDGFTGSWGFTPEFDYDNGYGSVFVLDDALMYFSKNYGWSPLAYNIDGYVGTTGGADDLAFKRYYSYVYYYR